MSHRLNARGAAAPALVAFVLHGALGCAITASPTPDARCTPAVSAPLPLLPNLGGAPLAHPRAVVVTFADDALRDAEEEVARFVLEAPDVLTRAVGEYGVGAGAIEAVVRLPMAAPERFSVDTMRSFLAEGIASGALPGAASGASEGRFYLVFLPRTSRLSNLGGSRVFSCYDFTRFHGEATLPSVGSIPFAVVPQCPAGTPGASDDPRADVEVAASRAIFDTALNPHPERAPAWTYPPRDDTPWTRLRHEATEFCEQDLVLDRGHSLGVAWSNRAASTGHAPCAGTSSEQATVGVVASPQERVSVTPGATVTWEVTGWASSCDASWDVSIEAPPSPLDVRLSSDRISNGGHLTLTLRVPPDAATRSVYTVWLRAGTELGAASRWPVSVVVR